jgi:hypothetical protein
MVRILRLSCWLVAVALAGCLAKRTIEIEPTASIDVHSFAGRTCSQLVADRAKRSQALVFAGLAQDQLSDDDQIRTLGVPTPMGTLFENSQETAIARLKAELRALNAELGAQNCGGDYK